jgi:hypothetical protein
MAEDKDKDGNELLGQDFLGDMQKNVDSMPTTGLFDKLAKLGAQQRLQPLADQKRLESSYKPLLKMVQDAEDRVTAGMLAHKLANPDIDDSKLHSGVGDLVTNTMTENNARFKELNRQLAYMSPRNPKYADIVAEIADINKASLGLRDQNAKLMEIKNTMNHEDFDIKEMSLGNAPGVKNMYSDIQKGVSDNFQTIDGKLYWVDPNPDIAEDDPAKKVSVESIKALAPEMTFGEAYVQHNGMLSAVSDMPADSPNYDQNLHFNVSTMFTEIGDAGVKSLIFDSENSEEDDAGNLVGWSNGGDMFNTSNWFESFYNDLGVTDPNQMIDIRQAIQKEGVTHKITGADGKERKVIDHFRKWYTDELKKVEKSEKGKPKAGTDLNNPYPDPRGDGDDTDETLNNTTTENVTKNVGGFDQQFDAVYTESNGVEEVFVPTLIEKMPWLDGKLKESRPGSDVAKITNDALFNSLNDSQFKNQINELIKSGALESGAAANLAASYDLSDSSSVDRLKMHLKVYSNVKNGIYPNGIDPSGLTQKQIFQRALIAQLVGNKQFSDYENWI